MLTTVNNESEENGPNGLPSIDSKIVLNGNGKKIVRSTNQYTYFRILHVTPEGELTLNDVNVEWGNLSETTYILYGGSGLYNQGKATVNRVTFSRNHGPAGGAIDNSGEITVSDSTIYNNGADTAGGLNNSGTAVINRSTFESNFGVDASGIYNQGEGVMTINDSLFTKNNGDPGAAILNSEGEITINNSTFSDNLNGIESTEGVVNINHSTIVNSVYFDGFGGGYGLNRPYSSDVTITDSIIANNDTQDCNGTVTLKDSTSLKMVAVLRLRITN